MNPDVLVVGQVLTSRTETIAEYFKYKSHRLAVIGLAGIRQRSAVEFSLHENGVLMNFHSFLGTIVGGSLWYHQLLIAAHYLLQFFFAFYSIARLRMRFHFVIGISTFGATIGILLKQMRFVEHTVYYSIDYPLQRHPLSILYRVLDRFCAENSDVVWNLSPAISRARRANNNDLKIPAEIIAPLTYSSKLLILKPLDKIERWTIAFVGTLDRLQGLQLLIEAMPEILKHLPNVIVKVIGDGPYAGELKRLVKESGLDEHFVFHGFLRKDSDMINIISRCAIGVAPFIPTPENNALTADPGKPKLYTFLGLPVIITKIPSGLLIDRKGAGIAIDYTSHEFANAVIKLLQDDQTLIEYRQNANLFAQSYTSERIFTSVLKTTLKHFRNNMKQKN